MTQQLQIQCSNEDQTVVLALKGRLTLRECPQLERQLRQFEQQRAVSIALDLVGLDLLDSMALGLLTATYKRCLDLGIALTLRHPPPPILHVFQLTHLDRVFHIETADGPAVGDRRSVTRSLWESFQSSQQLLAGPGDGLLALDADGRILLASRGATRMLGWSEETLRERWLAELIVRPDDAERWRSPRLLAGGGGQQEVLLARRADPPIEAYATWTVVERKGRVQGVLAALRETQPRLRSTNPSAETLTDRGAE